MCILKFKTFYEIEFVIAINFHKPLVLRITDDSG